MIKVLITLIFLLQALSSWASGTRQELIALLPKELAQFTSSQQAKQLRDKFKKYIDASKSTDETLYLNYFSKYNDVSIGLKDGHFHYLWVKATPEMVKKSTTLFGKTHDQLGPQEKDKISREINSSKHESGRSIVIDLPKEAIQLKFSNNERRTLQSFVIWSLDKGSP